MFINSPCIRISDIIQWNEGIIKWSICINPLCYWYVKTELFNQLRHHIMIAKINQLQDTDLFRFFSTELSTQSQLEKLLKENMPNGKETSKQSLEQIGIDWNKYM